MELHTPVELLTNFCQLLTNEGRASSGCRIGKYMEDKFGWERGGGGVGMMHHDGVPNNMFNGWSN